MIARGFSHSLLVPINKAANRPSHLFALVADAACAMAGNRTGRTVTELRRAV
jgi:hypothetical protein